MIRPLESIQKTGLRSRLIHHTAALRPFLSLVHSRFLASRSYLRGVASKKNKASQKETANLTKIAPAKTSDDSVVLFHRPYGPHGEFCQWFPSRFTVKKRAIASVLECPVNEVYYTKFGKVGKEPSIVTSNVLSFGCAEQFMMFCKALRFYDHKTADLVMATDSPVLQKHLGKRVRGFGDGHWDLVKSQVVVLGNMAKFGQDTTLRGKLMETGNLLLAEASVSDRVWGIGFSAENAMRNQKSWGENLLGRALMQVRQNLR